MDLLSFWLGTKVAKGEGRSAFLLVGLIFFVFIMLIAFFMADATLGVIILLVIFIIFIATLLQKKFKK